MRKSFVAVAFFAVMLLGASAFAGTITITDPNFSVNLGVGCTYAYQSTAVSGCTQQNLNATPGWTFSNLIGGQSGAGVVTSTNTAFPPPSFAALPPGITQAAFLQVTNPQVSQALSGFTVGQMYDLSFYLGSRSSGGNQSVVVTIGSASELFNLSSGTPFTLENVYFTANGISQTLTFSGTNPLGGDNTAFLTGVGITATPEPVTLILFGTGLVGIGGMVRRRLNR